MWQLMCCASELHNTNVKTIETLTQANLMLKEVSDLATTKKETMCVLCVLPDEH